MKEFSGDRRIHEAPNDHGFQERAIEYEIDPPSIIRPGYNSWKTGTVSKASFLIDGSAYFKALDHALRLARQTIWIVGWDFNPDIRLRPRESSETLGELLLTLTEDNPDLRVRILVWGMGPVYSGKSLRLFNHPQFSDHPQISMHFDLRHPLRGCHHQKLVAIDDKLAFLGGIDLTARRWDEPDHAPRNTFRRSPDGTPYDPVHDIQLLVSGEAATFVADVARRRWKRATGKQVPATESTDTSWPAMVAPHIADARVGIALTEPGLIGRRGRHEGIRLTRAAIQSARHSIYIETQYLASFGVARSIAQRLREADGPEIVVLVTKSSHGFIEKLTMGSNRDRVIRRLKRLDRHDRLRVMYAVAPDGNGGSREIVVHSKLVIIDDRFIRIGSSNLNNRSEGLDTECDLAIEASCTAHRDAIAAVRYQLMAEHLDTTPQAVEQAQASAGSMIKAIDSLNSSLRGLRPFSVDLANGETTPVIGTTIVDPHRPYHPLRRLRLRLTSLMRGLVGGGALPRTQENLAKSE